MKTIELTRGLQTVVDDDVYEWASQTKWCAYRVHNRWYAARRVRLANGRSTTQYLHRIIAGSRRGQDTDHKDGDGLNNLRSNIRAVTHGQNQQNVKGGYGITGVRGVSMSRSGRFVARVKINRKHVYCGTYETVTEAAEVARLARLQLMTHSDGR